MKKTTLCALLAAVALGGCTTTSHVGSDTSYAKLIQPTRPKTPTLNYHSSNVLEIETNGYDIDLESYLKPDKTSIVELSYVS